MIKLIIKNLWSHRRRNGWLLAELILITVVSWVYFDPIVVITSDFSSPLGYDEDRLCIVEVAVRDSRSSKYDATRADSASMVDDLNRIIDRISHRRDVERVSPLTTFTYMNSPGNAMDVYQMDSTTVHYINKIYFDTGYDYFDTYGIKTVAGSPSPAELSRMSMGSDDIIVTRTIAELYFPGENPLGKVIKNTSGREQKIVGVVEDVRAYSPLRNQFTAFAAQNPQVGERGVHILVRAKQGVNLNRFAAEFKEWMVDELKSGNLFARSIETYPEFNAEYEFFSGGKACRLNMLLAVFFLVNLCLGVIGTFWLQTRSRSEDAGVMRSFGATPSKIMRMLIGEGVILATIAWLTGCFGYMQWALSEGLSIGTNWMPEMCHGGWLSDFWSHFVGVSLIVYAVIMVVVVIGISIPAYRIANVNPVDALHEKN